MCGRLIEFSLNLHTSLLDLAERKLGLFFWFSRSHFKSSLCGQISNLLGQEFDIRLMRCQADGCGISDPGLGNLA